MACPRRVAETCRSALPASAQAGPALILKHVVSSVALFNPETSILIQKRHPYTVNLNSETSGDSKNAFLRCGDVFVCPDITPCFCGVED